MHDHPTVQLDPSPTQQLNLPPDCAVMICGHGSRNRNAVDEFATMATALRARLPQVPVEHGYLEFAQPVLRDGLDKLKAAGAQHILAVPAMLFAAGHAKNDIPSVLNTWAAESGIKVTYGRELGVDPRMIRAAADRVREALADAEPVPAEETLLMVVGRGASDPDANSNVAKITRMLWEGMGFGWAETSYSGVTFPLVEPALEKAARLGYRRIVTFPYFLFTGVLVKRIYAAVDSVAARHPAIEFLKAPYLDIHDQVLATLINRVGDMITGDNLMNCALCKYREQVLGFESDVGAAQHSHHHHVEGAGVGLENCPCKGDCDGLCRNEEFCRIHGLPFTPLHSHDHDHGDGGHGHHHHTPHPFADHPLGPKSLKNRSGRR